MKKKVASILGLSLMILLFVGGLAVLHKPDVEPPIELEVETYVMDTSDVSDLISSGTSGFISSDHWDTVRMGIAKGLPGAHLEAVNISQGRGQRVHLDVQAGRG